MSQTVDANLLLYAVNTSSPRYAGARKWVQEMSDGPRLFTLLWPVVSAFVRISTHPTVFDDPLDLATARRTVDDLLARPHIRTVSEEPGFWAHLDGALTEVSARGNLVTDAHLVALMRQHGIDTVWTADRDFRRFDGITVLDPFS